MIKIYGLTLLALALVASAFCSDPAPDPPLQSPANAIEQALADVQANAAQAAFYRYLWLGNSTAAERTDLLSVVNFTLNSLSRRKLIVPVTPVGDGSVVRVDLHVYGIDPDAWDQLGSDGSGPVVSTKKIKQPEPYFHFTRTTVVQEVTDKLVDCAPYQVKGVTYTKRWEKVPSNKKSVRQFVHGPWLPADRIAVLVLATQTDFPIFRADWFIANALLPPAYQRFLGVKSLKDFQEQVRFRGRDDDLAVKAAVLFSSEVAIHNRALLRTPTVLGSYWRSLDFLSSTDNADVLANVLEDKADANEIIAAAPNGLHWYLITDGQGKIIDFADPNVAIDRSTAWDNKLVWTGYSCIVCHRGYKTFKDDVRQLADKQKRIFALVKQGKDAERFTDLFGPNPDAFLAADQAAYAAAVSLATGGWTPEKNCAALSKIFLRYVQEPVTLERVSLETGYPKAELIDRLKTAQGLDHTLTQLIAELPVRRDQFEQSAYGQLMTLPATNTK